MTKITGSINPCPLCEETNTEFLHQDKKRAYLSCLNCDLIFVPSKYHLAPKAEKTLYDNHHNDISNPGYLNFLNRLAQPLKQFLKQGMQGLDFGSGPGPTLHKLLQQMGYETANYDPFYANDPRLLLKQYDFVTCTEVVEHFSNPKSSWDLLIRLLKPRGVLGVMTLLHDKADFPNWWYKNDMTHVAFYSSKTFRWIEKKLSLKIERTEDRVILFSRI